MFIGSYIFSAHVAKNLDPGHSRSGRQVTSSDLTLEKNLNARHTYGDWTTALKLSEIDTSSSIYKMLILEFWYWWPRVRPILRPLQCLSQWKNWKANKTILNTLKHWDTYRFDTLSRKTASSDPPPLMTPRSLQVMKGHQQFFGCNSW